jgi:hypothetical protein
MYDIIGDVHGHADELETLLGLMGYRRRGGAWRHPRRQVIFVGDFIDRGPQIARALDIARAMVEEGTARAVLGNHEWNALGYLTCDPDAPGKHLRRRDRSHRRQIRATLEQLRAAELRLYLDWFRTLPVALDLPGLRVVHACWDPAALAVAKAAWRRHGGLTDALLIEGHDRESLLFSALEILLKGKEMTLPSSVAFTDKDGAIRHASRVRWYMPADGRTTRDYALPPYAEIPAAALPAKTAAEAAPYPTDAPPCFFGHYWLFDADPAPLAANVACLDYSVAAGGFLCAYRHATGEKRLRRERFARSGERRLP